MRSSTTRTRQRLEGTYLFPVPKGAQIDKFAMDIGGKQVEAELLPADKARRIYEDIVRKLKDPALLEYAGRDVFKVRIFPIEPNSRKRITLSYTQLLKADDGPRQLRLSAQHGEVLRQADQERQRESGPGEQTSPQVHLFAEPLGRGEAAWRRPGYGGL